MKTRKFIDTAVMQARAGKGGDGAVSFRREKFVEFGGPDGGDGGKGGSVILVGDEDTDSLVSVYFEPRRFAQNGGNGAGRGMHGKNGADIVVPVPLGTTAKDESTDEAFGEIMTHGQRLVIAKGGRGGWGNVHWKRADHQVPMEFTPGKEGEEFSVRLDLRVMADAGLVGFPSAGKSSILAKISAAHPKIAAYHFTTLNPIIGTVMLPEKFASFRVADIPGIIRDAHLGIGLGLEFLRHIERTKALVFVIDMGGEEGRDPADDYKTLLAELEARDPALLERERVVVATKMDLPEAKANLKKFKKETGARPIETSTIDGTGFDKLITRLTRIIKPQPRVNGRPAVATASPETDIVTLGGKKSKRDTGLRYIATRNKRERKIRKGYTPPYEIEGRGENPDAEDIVSEKKQKLAGFLKI
ncbi:MAG: GTPase ObgE [Kiritimatiellaeota bacterium]|nr:GTPase ObgE [Kiritimatiellota bacterium]